MVAPPLRQEPIEAGRRLVEETDRLGLRAQGAAWLHEHELGDWRYYLVTPLVDHVGRITLYKAIQKILRHIGAPAELTAIDVHLAGPSDPAFLLLSAVFEATGVVSVAVADCWIGDEVVDAHIYRLDPAPPEADLPRIGREFLRNVEKLGNRRTRVPAS